MHKLAFIAVASLSIVLLSASTKTDRTAIAEDNKAQTLPEDKDWTAYVVDGDTTAAMNTRCLEGYKVLDKRMAQVLEAFYESLDDEGDTLLKENQEAWHAYALTKRSLAADKYRGGTLSGPVAGLSYIAENCRRIKELQTTMETYNTP